MPFGVSKIEGGGVYKSPQLRNFLFLLGMKWIITAARDRDKKKSMFHEKLADVLIETASFTGRVIQVKNEHHKTCEINRAYAHYRRTK